MRTYRFRIYPSKKQQSIIRLFLEISRQVYNKSLEYKISQYKTNQKFVTLYDLNKKLTEWKKENSDWSKIYAQSLCAVQRRLDEAFKGFFRRVKQGKAGFPRFKAEGRIRSIDYPQHGFKVNTDNVFLSKIGKIKLLKHREIQGLIKNLSVIRYSTNKYYLLIRVEDDVKNSNDNIYKPIGIDLGVHKLITFSNGESIDHPRVLKKSEKQIAQLQRRYAKDKSNKNKHSLSLAYEKLGNRRNDFAHKLSKQIVDKYSPICMEKLNIQSMNSFRSLNKSIRDACWAKLIQMIQYKASNAGKMVVLVDPANTSKTCSVCGSVKDIELDERLFDCSCGNSIDRDLNAAHNILRRGLASLSKD